MLSICCNKHESGFTANSASFIVIKPVKHRYAYNVWFSQVWRILA
jgi:hypothetical protein